jgi:hypothetical protein
MAKLNLNFSALPALVGGAEMTLQPPTDKELSKKFLIWFLQEYYHLEETEAADAVCDDTYDKGVDGIYVDESLKRIEILSSSLVKNFAKGIGDVRLKEFIGSLEQFKSSENIRYLEADKSTNKALKMILQKQEIAKKREEGYEIHGVYVTNATVDDQAELLLKHLKNFTLYDSIKLKDEYISLDKTPPISEPITFDISALPSMEYPMDKELTMVIAPISARELIQMKGILNNELFAPNIRYWLGKNTPVNKDMADSINDPYEHKLFPAFHNGLIILSEVLNYKKDDKITIEKYAVVNGCQSLRGLFENKQSISDDLHILTKFIKVAPDSPLGETITKRTNNQNGSRLRDFQSNSRTQKIIQQEFEKNYADEFYYRISRGEHPEWNKNKVIENELAGKLLLAFDLERPYECNSEIFTEEKHKEIFARKIVTADRIVMLRDILKSLENPRAAMTNRFVAAYALTRYFLIYLVRQVLEKDATGKQVLAEPSKFFTADKNRARLQYCFGKLAETLGEILDDEVELTNEEGYFDYKTQFKSKTAVRTLAAVVLRNYKREIRNPRYAVPFSQLWINSETEVKNAKTKN